MTDDIDVDACAVNALQRSAPGAELPYRMDAYLQAANYLWFRQPYPCDNPLLKRALALSDVKSLGLGHWCTTPGQLLIYVQLNRGIVRCGLDMFYVPGSGPWPGEPAWVAPPPGVDPRRPGSSAIRSATRSRLLWPLIVLRSPKEWIGPKMVDGVKIEGTFLSHQVPLLVDAQLQAGGIVWCGQ